jgi:hypothetical protein
MIRRTRGTCTVAAGAICELGVASSPVITRVLLTAGASEWVLVKSALRHAPPAMRGRVRARARDLVAGSAPDGRGADPGSFTLVRVPAVDTLLGTAMLHYSALSGTVIYCQEKQITDIALGPLEDHLGAVLSLNRSLPHGRSLTARLPLIEHDQMPRLLDPVGPVLFGPHAVTAWVCDQHLTAELADWLAALCTVQGRLLRHSERAASGLPGRAAPRRWPARSLAPVLCQRSTGSISGHRAVVPVPAEHPVPRCGRGRLNRPSVLAKYLRVTIRGVDPVSGPAVGTRLADRGGP